MLTEQLGIDTDDTDALCLPEGRQLLLSSDFYTVYQSLGRLDGVDNLWCWAHYPDLRVMPTKQRATAVFPGQQGDRG